MRQIELLRHVANNLEAGRDLTHGLLFNGKTITDVLSVDDLLFDDSHLYSLAPRTRLINGIETPEPIYEAKSGQLVWIEDPRKKDCCKPIFWTCGTGAELALSRGLCYDSEEAAATNCRARYDILD